MPNPSEPKLYLDSSDRLDKYEPHGSDIPEDLLSQIKLQELGTVADLVVVVVDGYLIRGRVDIDFTDEGNPGRYGYINDDPGELWLDKTMPVEGRFGDAAAYMLHALVEYHAMRDDQMTYDQAHDAANDHEWALRQALLDGSEPEPQDIQAAMQVAEDWALKSGHLTGGTSGVEKTDNEQESTGDDQPDTTPAGSGLSQWASKAAQEDDDW